MIGVIAIVLTVWFRRGIWGQLAARSRFNLFPVGYRVDVTAPASPQPSARSRA